MRGVIFVSDNGSAPVIGVIDVVLQRYGVVLMQQCGGRNQRCLICLSSDIV